MAHFVELESLKQDSTKKMFAANALACFDMFWLLKTKVLFVHGWHWRIIWSILIGLLPLAISQSSILSMSFWLIPWFLFWKHHDTCSTHVHIYILCGCLFRNVSTYVNLDVYKQNTFGHLRTLGRSSGKRDLLISHTTIHDIYLRLFILNICIVYIYTNPFIYLLIYLFIYILFTYMQ